jgi:hypothetical protein
MKLDPFFLLGAYGVTGVAAATRNPAYALDFMLALAAGGLVALCFSLLKSRQRKADGIDTSLWAMIALVGSTGLAYVLAPVLDGRTIPLIGITLTQPLAAFLIALGGTPFIEWVLSGEAFALARRWIERREKGA